ncbi:unnamed protein product [Paramecium octaurelia]|uniref:Transmembrane protein n=1 Tax=Paramecium octaurelia TaxID=43137 RepID=A0A8S1YSB8_PAROT|nr:unnamed protein product [Paramecium octaurelia]
MEIVVIVDISLRLIFYQLIIFINSTLIVKKRSFCNRHRNHKQKHQFLNNYFGGTKLFNLHRKFCRDLNILQWCHLHCCLKRPKIAANNKYARVLLTSKSTKKKRKLVQLIFKVLKFATQMSSKLYFFRIFDDETNQIYELFYQLHVDQNFKPNLCNDFLIHYNHLQNIVICDRNFITLLSLFLTLKKLISIYQRLVTQPQRNLDKLGRACYKALQIMEFHNSIRAKKGNQKQYHSNKSMQLIFNFMTFLFGSLGIYDIFSSYKEIAKFFDYKSDPEFLICRIAQTDYDLI